jgi:UDP-N-acetylglucosamine acyltransferase
MIGGGVPLKLGGINLVGLRRHQFSYEVRKALSQAFRLLYRSSLKMDMALLRIKEELPQIPEIVELVLFCETTKRGLTGMQGITKEERDSLEE